MDIVAVVLAAVVFFLNVFMITHGTECTQKSRIISYRRRHVDPDGVCAITAVTDRSPEFSVFTISVLDPACRPERELVCG